ncbi:hypothetical protein LSTR_LSTR004321 [Laodelphax striatellus]|uniref:Uricase n=1 Tax=Laodelphax striatellus TaxID=195883 RepID=A0A482X935_LAOST|nr:hypothetical protein LSTR_LSTR004321 [Laodelphax striatellus]
MSNNQNFHSDETGKYVVYDNTSFNSTERDDNAYDLQQFGYGKNNVKVLYVQRNGPVHSIRECEVDVRLQLTSKEDYLSGDNSRIIATDSQKNTVYILARKYGIKSPEQFALILCQHFINVYNHIEKVRAHILDYPWQRLQAGSNPHNHAFIMVPSVTRYCTVTLQRKGVPNVISGLKDLRVIKTTQSAFRGFLKDEYRTLPDAEDRIFSTVVDSSWEYSEINTVDYDRAWTTVKDCILEKFAGPPKEGIYSPSVQNTLYLAERLILDKLPEVENIEMSMPNKHYFEVNFSKFPKWLVGEGPNDTVFLPVDKPSGFIHAKLGRAKRNDELVKSKL